MRWRLALLAAVLALALWPEATENTCAATAGELLGGIRNARGDSIPVSALLSSVAEQRADQIVANFSHDDGGLRARLLPGGLHFAEILAYNSYPEDITEAYAVHQWLESSAHRAIMLGDWTHVGVGVANAEPSHYYAVLFADMPGTLPDAPRDLPATDTC